MQQHFAECVYGLMVRQNVSNVEYVHWPASNTEEIDMMVHADTSGVLDTLKACTEIVRVCNVRYTCKNTIYHNMHMNGHDKGMSQEHVTSTVCEHCNCVLYGTDMFKHSHVKRSQYCKKP